jgi:outer membrane receptor for ferrienterochelin and colicins
MSFTRCGIPGRISNLALTAALVIALLTGRCLAADEPTDIKSASGSAEMITLATGYRQPIIEAPATVSIISRQDIEQLAPRSLADIVNHIAGFHVAPSPDGRGTVIIERARDRQVVFMVDDIPYIRGLLFGWPNLNDVLPYDIERIEVLRGVASAVYGADAAGGVINIVTRSHSDPPGIQVGTRIGSFNSKDAWLHAGTRWHDVALNLYGAFRTTDETNAIIERDAQSSFDALLGTQASHAPGHLQGHRDVVEARGNLETGPWKLTLAHFGETNFHVGAGIAEALDPNGRYNNWLESADLTYHRSIDHVWDLSAFLSYSFAHQNAGTAFFPAGAFGGAFPQGVLDGLRDHENRERLEISILRRALGGHDLRFGLGQLYDRFVLDEDVRNFVVVGALLVPTGLFAPGAGVGDPPAIRPTSLQSEYAYAQDEWTFTRDWRLTSGLRWDRYASFGTILNPRVGLVWVATPALSVKLLYATAFAPPNLTDTSSNGIFGGLGNPTLRPERSRTFELGTSLEHSRLRADATIFFYHDTHLIQLLSSNSSVNGLEYFNRGQAQGCGIETALKYHTDSGISLSGAYALHRFLTHDQDTDQEFSLAARHQVTTEASVPIGAGLRWEVNSLSILGRDRPTGDPRPAPRNYTLIGANVAWRATSDVVELRVGARNLLNTDAREPNSTPQGIYYDLPLPGREFFASARVSW